MLAIKEMLIILNRRIRFNKIRTNNRPNIKSFLLIVLVFTLVITTLPIFQSTNAGALTTSQNKETDLDWQIQSYIYYQTISGCMFNNSQLVDGTFTWNNYISNDKAKAGRWFGEKENWAKDRSTSINIGYYMDGIVGENGVVRCGDASTSLVKSALSLWGLDPIDVLCNSGFRRVDAGGEDQTIQTCKDRTTDFEYRKGGSGNAVTKFRLYIKGQIYDDKEPILTSAQEYLYYRHTLNESCIPGIDTKAPTVPPITYPDSDKQGYNNVSWVSIGDDTNPPAVITGSYSSTGTFKKTDKINVLVDTNTPNGTSSDKTCSEVVKLMNTSALIPKSNPDGYLSWVIRNPGAAIKQKEDAEKVADVNTTTCAIEGIGWMVCPVLKFLGGITDSAFTFLANSFLSTNISLVNSDSTKGSTGAYTAWQVMRNIANIAFVIAFLIIIFSQITSYGVDNYGIKKLLPRVIIAAILVNISFFVCQIAIDLSNIVGYSLSGLFDSIISSIPAATTSPNTAGVVAGVFTWAGITLAAVGAGAALLLSITVPVLLAALVAVLMIILILLARTALIVILVVISPLAFVAYLLPNTEQWFKKWGKTFVSLLMVFPIIALVFGGGKLAAQILNSSAGNDYLLHLIAMGVGVVPLFAVPSLLKGSMNAAGSIGTKLAGLSSKVNGNIGKKVKDTSMLGAYSAARTRNSQIKRAQITGGVYRGNNALTRLISDRNQRLNAAGVTGQMGNRTAQQAAQLANKLDVENVEAANAQIKQANITSADLGRIANGESVRGLNGRDASTRAAAMSTLLERGRFADTVDPTTGAVTATGFQTAWNNIITNGSQTRDGAELMRTVSSTVMRSKDRPSFMGAGDLQSVQEGNNIGNNGVSLRLQDMAQRGAIRYSPNKLAATSNDEIEYVIASNPGGVPANSPLRQAAYTAINNPEISQGIGNNRPNIETLANGWIPPHINDNADGGGI